MLCGYQRFGRDVHCHDLWPAMRGQMLVEEVADIVLPLAKLVGLDLFNDTSNPTNFANTRRVSVLQVGFLHGERVCRNDSGLPA